VDLFPTVLELLGLPVPAGLQGRSFAGRLRGEGDPDPERARFSQALTMHKRVPHVPVRFPNRSVLSSVRVGNLKLIEYPTLAGGWYRELFDLARDPGELANRADEDPELADRLGAALSEWRGSGGGDAGEPLPALSPETVEVLRSLGYVE
jgi:arylsulfatase A-like enzyme